MLVSTKSMLKKAQKEGYAVGAFNTSNLEMTKAIIKAAEDLNSPVIIQTSTKAIDYAGIEEMAAIVKTIAKWSKVPIALHLDHGPDIDWAKKCLDHGWTSIMIDASSLPYPENVRITKEVVALAKRKRASVEAEIGALAGIEDNVKVSEEKALFTDPNEAARFVDETGCDSLAIAVGTSHGPYKFKNGSNLDFERIKEIRKKVKVPLVLHGASSVPKEIVDKARKYGAKIGDAVGVSDEHLRKAIECGICKINTDSDIRLMFDASLREELSLNPEVYDPREILGHTTEAIYELVKKKMILFGSAGKG